MRKELDGGTGSEKTRGSGDWFWELKSGSEGVGDT